MFVLLLFLASIVLCVIAAFPVPSRVSLGWLGVACLAGALLCEHLGIG